MPKISKQELLDLKFYFNLLKINHQPVLAHVKRVAFLSARTAFKLHKDPKAAFLGGIYHDIGKLTQPAALFEGRNITPEEYATVQQHALAGFVILKDRNYFTSLITGLHHNVAKDPGYGLFTKDLPPNLSPQTIKKLLDIATIVSICDFIDAYTTRTTKGFGIDNAPLQDLLSKRFPQELDTIKTALQVLHHTPTFRWTTP
jgi:putative nucleotidyltransferase with HDIG domain